jgi:hypothetical protein
VVEFPEISRQGWMRIASIFIATCVAQLLYDYSFVRLMDRNSGPPSASISTVAMVVSAFPLIAVLSWKGELSFFDSFKERGRIKGWRLWVIPGIPAVVTGVVSLIEYPQGYTLFYNQIKTVGVDTFGVCALGLGLLSAACLTPTIVKWLGDNADWKWFLGLASTVSMGSDLVRFVYGIFLRGNPSLENSPIVQATPTSLLLALVNSVLPALAFLILMLWSKGDIRAAIAASLFAALSRFIAPTHASIPGMLSAFAGVFLLWLAVGGMSQLQRSRQTVAEPNLTEV